MPTIPAGLKPEWSVLLTACSRLAPDEKQLRLRYLLESRVHWQRLFALADQHGVQPLLHQSLDGVRDLIPAEHWRALEQSHQTNLHKALLLSRELIRIVRHLRESGLDVMPYKGPALAEFLYGDIALRQSGDIDLLVRLPQFSRAQAALAKLGYEPQMSFSHAEQSAYLKSGYECVFDGPAGRNVLEVQWAVEPRFYTVDFDMDCVFDRAVTVAVAGQEMKTPSPADLFLILAVHAAKHAWARLIWISDLARLMTLPSLDWDWIASQAKDLGLLRIVTISMLLANRLLGEAIPEPARDRIPRRKIDEELVSAVQQHILSESAVNVEALGYFRLMLRLRERTTDRLRFLTRLAFTPGPGEWKAVRLPASLFPLYRVVRLSRLVGRIFLRPGRPA